MSAPIKGKRRYIPGIDGLRGIAVLSVIAYHLNFNHAPGGLLGVVIFFVLSGYLITDLALDEWKRNGFLDLKMFWIRRIQRLFPALLVMLILIVSWLTFFEPVFLSRVKGDVLASLFYISNWWFILHKVSYFESFETPTPFSHLWSLAVEEQFYIVWPLLLTYVISKSKKISTLMWMTLLIAILSFIFMAVLYQPGKDPSRVYYGTDTRVFSILFGSAVALIWPAKRLSKKTPKAARITLDILGSSSLFILLLLIFRTNQYDMFLYRGGMLLASIASAVLVAVIVHPASMLSKLLSFKPLRWIGIRSYGIYLWQYPIIILTNPAQDTGLWRQAIQIAFILIISALSWKYIENPIRSIGIITIWQRIRSRDLTIKNILLYQKFILAGFIILFMVSSAGMIFVQKSHPISTAIPSFKVNGPEQTDENPEVKAAGPRISVIGDSVMVDVAPYLEAEFTDIVVDAKIGRQMGDAKSVIEKLKAEGKLGNIVVIELGTNGPFTRNQLDSVLTSIGLQRSIILVNVRVTRPWEKEVNSLLTNAANTYPNITLVNWHDESIGNTGYFYPDGVHPNKTGSQVYADLIVKAAGLKGAL